MEWSEFFVDYGPAFFWLFVAIAAAIVESATCDLVSVWFVPGALAAMISSFFVNWLWLQLTLFLGLSLIMLVMMKVVFKKYLPQSKPTQMNADAMIGTHCLVTETIDNLHEQGSVKIKGVVWSARSTDDAVKIEAGQLVTVAEIAGVKLICKPYTEAE